MKNTLQYNGASYGDAQIKAAQAAMDTSLNERTLDVDTMTVIVQSQTSLAAFSQNEPVYFLRGGSQYAQWYLKDVKRVSPDLWTLSMMSSLGRLSQMAHRGGIYNGVVAGAVIDDICGAVPHLISNAFVNVRLYGYLPYVSPSGENGARTGNAKDNLLQVLFALNATVRDDTQGTLRIESLPTSVSSILGADRIYRDNAQVIYEPPITSVTVLEHQYISGGDLTTLFEGTTTSGQVIVFREPMSDLTATGFSIIASSANYAILSAGTGVLTGQKYIHTTREITRSVTAAAIPNQARIEDATLVSITNSGDVANRLVDFYAHRTTIECDATIEFEDAGDVVSIFDPYDKIQRDACIEKISPLNISQTMKGRISAIVGLLPWQVEPFTDEREILTDSGTWTAPADIAPDTEITVILIGGGEGGASGHDGEDATDGEDNRRYGSGGLGGQGGAGGRGGNILRVSITVQPGEQIAYSVGIGGTGARAGTNGADGSYGDDTVFGSYSSADGSPSGQGYTDQITAETLATPGDPGAPGGRGDGPAEYSETVSIGNRHWFPGDKGSNVEGYVDGFAYGGWGGGAAAGAHGEDGGDGTTSYNGGNGFNQGGDGGAGADAIRLPDMPTVFGKGGGGGYGGGGGGGGGYAAGSDERYIFSGSGGLGGSGGHGGDAAPGCIILYYRKPVTD